MRGRVYSIGTIDKSRLRKRYPLSFRAVAGVLLLVFVTMALHGNWLLALVLVGGGLGVWQLAEALQRRREREVVLQDIVTQTDSEFLRFAADLLRAQGYGVLKTSHVDNHQGNLLIMHGAGSFACRVMRARRRLRRTEIAHTLAQMKLHGCKGSMILTNRAVSWGAAHFARRVGCLIIDRHELVRLILQYRQGHRVYTFQREETTRLRRQK
jgi:restriction endonuclease